MKYHLTIASLLFLSAAHADIQLSKDKTMIPEIKIGAIYKHYKNKDYRIIGVARHSETLEELVVYQALYDSPQFGMNSIWVRPKSMFLEEIELNGIKVPRFQLKHDQCCQ